MSPAPARRTADDGSRRHGAATGGEGTDDGVADRRGAGTGRGAHPAQGCLVDPTAGHGGGAGRLRRLRHLGRLHRPRLLRRPLPVPVLLALPDRQLRARDLAAHRRLVEAVAGPARPAVPARLPADLLLLPQGLLPLVLVGAAGVRGAGRPRALHRRDPLPAHPPERPPLLLLPGAALSADPDVGRAPGLPL